MAANGATTGGDTAGSRTAKAGLGGAVYGGQSPITGATVTLWAAGTTGSYGSGQSQIATTTTDGTGSFSFNVSGVSPCTTGQLLYITSVGGNTGGGTNQYAALLAALPSPCSPATANTYVVVNEVTTVASVTALQQFMSITPGGTPAWTIGAPAANSIGLANAFSQVGNLVSIGSGNSGVTTATNTISTVTYTTTITPDSTKINTLADILAACVNTAGSSACTSLFADTTPTSSTAPTDTIQVVYYLATNAGGVNLPNPSGEPVYLANKYIPGTGIPFNPYSATLADWAVGVSWSTNNGTSTIGTTSAYSVAIDGSGNVWTANSVVSGSDTNPANITEFNPAGQVQFAPVGSTTITTGPMYQYAGGTGTIPTATSYTGNAAGNFIGTMTNYATAPNPTVSVLGGRGSDLAIDTNNNAWFAAYNTSAPATTGALQGLLTEVTPTGSSNGVLIPALVPGVLTIDGNNNIFLDDEPASGRFYTSELEFSNAIHPGTYAVFDEGIDRQTATEQVVWADSSGYVWSVASGGKCTPPNATIYRGNTADLEKWGALGVSGDDVTGSSGCPLWGGFSDGSGGSYFTQSGGFGTNGLYHVAISGGSASISAPVLVSEAAGTGTTNGGLDGANGVFVDGLGNIWTANSLGGVSEFSFATGAFVPLSPAGTAVYGFGTSYLTGKTPYYVAGDSSGNLWIGSADTALHYLVGIAGPTITPISAMLKAGWVGERPGAQTLASITPSLAFSTLTTSNQTQTATLTNTGSASVNISGVSFGGANAGNFSVTNNTCGSALAIGASCSITVKFASTTAGSFSGILIVASNAAGSPATTTLTATSSASQGTINLQAGAVPPSGPALSFGTVVAPSTTAPQAVLLTNTGSTSMPLSLGMTGTGANLFPQTTTCGSSLAAGASCFVSLKFAPKVAGSYSAALTVTNNAGTGTGASLSGTATPFTITLDSTNPSAWAIDNGAITFKWNSTTAYLNSWVLDGYSDQLVDTTTLGSGSQIEGLYSGMVGPFMNGTPTSSCTMVGVTVVGTPTTTCTTGSGTTPYLDWAITWLDTASPTLNDYTFVWHYVVFPNDPGVHTYVQLIHNASNTNPVAGGVGQIQWIFRDNQSIFTHTYEVNSSLNWLGVEDIPLPSVAEMASSDPGRVVQNAAEDLHGFTDLPAGFERVFMTKYDYAGYEYLEQAHGLYGPASSGTTYGVWTVIPKLETFVGGPTKQNLWFTENIDMIEAYSNHEDNNLSLATPAGVASNRLFGPYYIHVNTLGTAYNQTGNTLASQADMYADAISAEAGLVNQYDNVTPLVAAGYVPSTGRGSVSIQMNNVIGAPHTAWAVLSDPNTNIQFSTQGMQYWADISSTGSATITGVAPGTYRLSVYVLGQWGEYRQDGIVVTANNTATATGAFVPETFTNVNGTASGETVFTIGTADRSSHEFLHGHNTVTGNEDREYWGNWNYWADFAANQGAMVYYATAVGSTPATNDLSKWNYVHWGAVAFDPGLYDPNSATPPAGGTPVADNTYGYDDYSNPFGNSIPAYVASLPTAAGTNGVTTPIPAWQVYFATPADIASYSSGYAQLSISQACEYGSSVVNLNGHQLIRSRANYSDCMIRSGLSGYTEWFVMEFPASYLNQTPGGSNEITVTVTQQGLEDDAWRLELTNNTSNPATTGWNDYAYVSSSTTTPPNDAVPNP